jgi:hypothetical protein
VFVSSSLIDALVPRGLGVPEAERDSVLDQVAGFVRAEGALAPLPIRLGLTALSLALLAWLGVLALGRRDREAALEYWDRFAGAPGRALTRMLRSLTLIAYLDHPLVRSRMGVATVPERQRHYRAFRARAVASGRDRPPSS